MDDDGLQYDSGYDSDGAELNRLTGHWGYGRPQMSKQAKVCSSEGGRNPSDRSTC